MRLTSEELKESYRKETARASWQRADCLSAEEMMRAAEGQTSQAERKTVADHLMACADCAEEYRLVRSLKTWAETAAASVDEANNLAGVKPESILRLDERRVSSAPRSGWRRRIGTVFSPMRASYAMAAALFVVTLALGFWSLSLYRENRSLAAVFNQQLQERDQTLNAAIESLAQSRQQAEESARQSKQFQTQLAERTREVERLSQPRINIPIVDLNPGDSTRGNSPGSLTTVDLPAGVNFFTLILNIAIQQDYPDYELNVVDSNGKLVWRRGGLQKNEWNNFTVGFSRRLIPAGKYRMKIYGLRNSRRELLEDYAVSVKYR